MKWIKHYSNTTDSTKINKLLAEKGVEGYGFYWLFLELLSAKFDGTQRVIELSLDEVLAKFRLNNRRKLVSLLEVLNKLELIPNKTQGKFLQIDAYILLKLKQKDFKTKLSESDLQAENSPLDIRRDKRIKSAEADASPEGASAAYLNDKEIAEALKEFKASCES